MNVEEEIVTLRRRVDLLEIKAEVYRAFFVELNKILSDSDHKLHKLRSDFLK